MATQVQFRGGTTTEHASFNGVAKEVTVDTTKQTLVVQDGSTNGGFPLLRENGTQNLITTGDIKIDSDSTKLYLGADYELQVFHNGTDSIIKDTRNAGSIKVQADLFQVIDKDAGQTLFSAAVSGPTKLFYGGGTDPKLSTQSYGVQLLDAVVFDNPDNAGKDINWAPDINTLRFSDSVKGTFGASDDLQIFHNGTRSKIQNNTGELRLCSNTVELKNYDDDETFLTATDDGAVQLYNDNIVHFTTHGLGIKVLGATGGTAQIDIQPDQGTDNADKWKVGAEDDGHFFISNKDSGAWDKSIAANRSGNVELYYDGGTAKLSTTASGVKIASAADTRLTLGSGGTEGTNDSVHIRADGANLNLMAATAGITKFEVNGTETLNIAANGDATFAGNINPGSNNSKSIGDGTNNFASVWASTRFRGGDGVSLNLGGSQDFIIRHVDGTGNVIESPTGSDLHIKMMGGSMDVADQTSATFVEDGAVKLYYDGSGPMFETKSTGARVTGNFEAYANSSSAASAGVFYNNNSAAGADCRVQIKTYSNQGADPYIHFDAGGTNFIVGEKWEGTTNNQLLIGPGDSPSTGTTGFRMNAQGKVGLNTDPSNFRLKVVDTAHSPIQSYTNNGGYHGLTCQSSTSATTQYYWQGIRSDGNQDGYIVSASAGTVALTNTSDYRLKDNVVSMTNGIDIIKKLNPITYKWSESSGRNTTNTMQGFLAHEVDEAGVIGAVDGVKDAVWDTAENPVSAAIGDPKYQGLSLERLVPSLTAALKEAIAKIETLETKVAALESS